MIHFWQRLRRSVRSRRWKKRKRGGGKCLGVRMRVDGNRYWATSKYRNSKNINKRRIAREGRFRWLRESRYRLILNRRNLPREILGILLSIFLPLKIPTRGLNLMTFHVSSPIKSILWFKIKTLSREIPRSESGTKLKRISSGRKTKRTNFQKRKKVRRHIRNGRKRSI